MKKIRRSALMVMFAMVAASIISVGTVYADGDPPGGNPACGPEPSQEPHCFTQESCDAQTACTSGPYGTKWTYCCVELPTGFCRVTWGRYKCCNGTWKKECQHQPTDGTQNCNRTTGHCY